MKIFLPEKKTTNNSEAENKASEKLDQEDQREDADEKTGENIDGATVESVDIDLESLYNNIEESELTKTESDKEDSAEKSDEKTSEKSEQEKNADKEDSAEQYDENVEKNNQTYEERDTGLAKKEARLGIKTLDMALTKMIAIGFNANYAEIKTDEEDLETLYEYGELVWEKHKIQLSPEFLFVSAIVTIYGAKILEVKPEILSSVVGMFSENNDEKQA